MLTDTKIKTLKPKDKRYRIADANGLVLEVKPNGAKYWRYRYRFEGKANMISIGEYPFVTLAQARQNRDKYKSLLNQSINPSAYKKKLKRKKLQIKYQNNQHLTKCFVIGMNTIKRTGSLITEKTS